MLSTVELDSNVMEKELCVNCGACEGLCPYWHSLQGRMMHDFECSREEGRCTAFCPRMPTDIKALRDRFFEADTVMDGLGPFRALYITRAADPAIREGSQHGGTVTALTELALREGFIDAAVTVRTKGGLSPEGTLAATSGEIRACRGSSFQIPASLSVLNAALKEGRYKKLGLVGTPCKTLAAYKMMAKPLPEKDNNADNIGFVFGLFCGWGLEWDGLAALLKRHAGGKDLRRVDIPPSKYHCMTAEGEAGNIRIDLDEVTPLVRQSCRYCTDMTAEFSDISVGGARSADGWDVDRGWNQTVVRSKKGEALMDLALIKGVLEFKEVPEHNFDRLKAASLNKKRAGIKNIVSLTGNPEDLGYLNPSTDLFAGLKDRY